MSTTSTATPSPEHDGNALADMLGEGPVCCGGGSNAGHAEWCSPVPPAIVEEPHPVPHVGCMACDPATVATKRAQIAGIRRTRPRSAPNRVRVVDLGGALLVVPEGAA